MSTTNELAALLPQAAIAPLTDRAFLRISGPDATRWLNGMVTNSIQTLQPGEGCYSFLLNAQGRIQGDCTIYRESGDPVTYLLETDSAQLETIRTLLDKFIIMDDVELSDTSLEDAAFLLIGASATDTLRKLGLPTPEPMRLTLADTPHGPVLLLTSHTPNVFELRAETGILDALRSAAALPEVPSETLEQARILSGVPRFGTDIRDKDLAQETNQQHALHFNKGCYLGQEIVERIRSRGQVHRLFTRFELTGTLPTQLPAPLASDGKPAGEITSATQIGEKLYALGYGRREFLDTDAPLTYPGGSASKR